MSVCAVLSVTNRWRQSTVVLIVRISSEWQSKFVSRCSWRVGVSLQPRRRRHVLGGGKVKPARHNQQEALMQRLTVSDGLKRFRSQGHEPPLFFFFFFCLVFWAEPGWRQTARLSQQHQPVMALFASGTTYSKNQHLLSCPGT